ncbi:oxidoreductase domain protein [Thalassoporum mexicanum PCC 7367]|uniref:Gfo/Idh/MocA family protein n=1 Tax=Thalassoporum mexicanum TaxID=3457544 RepID=UPI00029FDB86|nr:Gfo/Idh/MocA family oxidoreductase [Pseudanabaena sp. PCC 7367]AFY69494.1 oxidoreductase domain protein [Pseudanabaena sp. PCC 7367]
MRRIGVGVVGTGFGQKIHLPGLKDHPTAVPVAVYNRDRTKAQQVASKFGVPNACDRLEDLLAISEVEAVSITTPPFLHYDMAKQVLQASKHLLLEKPVTLSLAEAIDLYKISQDKGVIIATDFEFRCLPHWRYLKHLLDQGFVGKQRSITIDWIVQGRANPTRQWNWYAQKELGGGALGALGSHTFDYVHWLFGSVKQICGQLSTGIKELPDADGKMRPVDSDDTCNILLELADGTPCNIAISTVAYRGRGHWVTVYGEEGTLVLGNANMGDYIHGFSLQRAKAGAIDFDVVPIPQEYQLPKSYEDGRLAPFIAICDRFTEAIVNNGEMTPGMREGVYSQLLMDLTHQSHAEGRWLDVPGLDQVLNG